MAQIKDRGAVEASRLRWARLSPRRRRGRLVRAQLQAQLISGLGGEVADGQQLQTDGTKGEAARPEAARLSWSQTAEAACTAAQGRVSVGSCRRFRIDRMAASLGRDRRGTSRRRGGSVACAATTAVQRSDETRQGGR
ncbi:hypothetical protein IAQ61_006548 [Plenodomus lingam]|uniref:uncharacterized protein n=1 Tax=Leptosphaeria maculans TaxID=5022 RepID=UPI003327C583|nr:hypothetical protein IAQ61_006548 [Plenodomus lingam]